MTNNKQKMNLDFNESYIADVIRVACYRNTGYIFAEELIGLVMSYKTHSSPIDIIVKRYKEGIYNDTKLLNSIQYAFNQEDEWLKIMPPRVSQGLFHNNMEHYIIGDKPYTNDGKVYCFASEYLDELPVNKYSGGFVDLETNLSKTTFNMRKFHQFYIGNTVHYEKLFTGWDNGIGKHNFYSRQEVNIVLKTLRKQGWILPFADKTYNYEDISEEMCLSVLQFWLVSVSPKESNHGLIIDSENFCEDVMTLCKGYGEVFNYIADSVNEYSISTILNKIKGIIFDNGLYKFAKTMNKLLPIEQRKQEHSFNHVKETEIPLDYYSKTRRYNDQRAGRNYLNNEAALSTRNPFLDFSKSGGHYQESLWFKGMDKATMIIIIGRYNTNNNDKLKYSKSWSYKRLYRLWITEGASEETRLNKAIFNRIIKVLAKKVITKANIKKDRYFSHKRVIDFRNRVLDENYY